MAEPHVRMTHVGGIFAKRERPRGIHTPSDCRESLKYFTQRRGVGSLVCSNPSGCSALWYIFVSTSSERSTSTAAILKQRERIYNKKMGAGSSAEIPGGGTEGYHVLRVCFSFSHRLKQTILYADCFAMKISHSLCFRNIFLFWSLSCFEDSHT